MSTDDALPICRLWTCGNISCQISMILVSVGLSVLAVNPSVVFYRARVRFAGLVADIVVCSLVG